MDILALGDILVSILVNVLVLEIRFDVWLKLVSTFKIVLFLEDLACALRLVLEVIQVVHIW
jgi:hypothetical protein